MAPYSNYKGTREIDRGYILKRKEPFIGVGNLFLPFIWFIWINMLYVLVAVYSIKRLWLTPIS